MPEENKTPSLPIIRRSGGKYILVLDPDSEWPFAFGAKKARQIVELFEFIKEYDGDYGLADEEEINIIPLPENFEFKVEKWKNIKR